VFRGLVLVLAAAMLAACAIIDPVDSRYDTISRSLAKARNEAILLNLVRASHNYPLDFVTIANVTPSMSNTTSMALPNFLLGPRLNGALPTTVDRDVVFGNTTASNSTAVSTNFSVSTQETSGFYEGFLKPIDLEVADYFIRQNYSRELLFWMFVDSVEVDIGPRRIGSRFDPPNDYGCNPANVDPKQRCFSDFVLLAIGSGLTVEEKTAQSTGSSAGSRGNDSDITNKSSSSSAPKTQTTIYTHLCFDPILARQAQAQITQSGTKWSDLQPRILDDPRLVFSPICGDPWDPRKDLTQPQPDFFPFKVGPYTFKIRPRSAYGVFKFLGLLMKVKHQNIEPPVGNITPFIPRNRHDDQAQQPLLWESPSAPSLVNVIRGLDPNVKCFAHTWFEDGDYCVPDDAESTKTIISLLAQLIAIQTSATDLSITPLVRVVQ
jgi:hypothetical protein